MNANEKYRLRQQNRIVGYAEHTPEGMLFTGKYPLFWLKEKQAFDQVDRATGVLDKLNRMVYERDIVLYKINARSFKRTGVVLCHKETGKMGVYDIDSHHFTCFFVDDLALFVQEKLEIVSHLFNHPHLNLNLDL